MNTYYAGNGLYEETLNGNEYQYSSYVDGMFLHQTQGDTYYNIENIVDYFFHQDHLGSINLITNRSGAVTQVLDYNPWGERIGASNNTPTIMGFTGHNMLDEVGLVHMGGRVYDPLVSRFISADLFIQAPTNTQSYNRYSYVWNNPLSYTDPSGYVACLGLTNASLSNDTDACALNSDTETIPVECGDCKDWTRHQRINDFAGALDDFRNEVHTGLASLMLSSRVHALMSASLSRYDRLKIKRAKKKHKRRLTLYLLARGLLNSKNHVEALTSIVNFAAALVTSLDSPEEKMMEDLKLVLIGTGLTTRGGRSKGRYFAGHFRGALGFKSQFVDENNQVQHAIAGVYIAFKYGFLGEQYTLFNEGQQQDILLYKVVFPLGRGLNEGNYNNLGNKLYNTLHK